MGSDELGERAIGVVGTGRVAQALGRLLADRGEPVTCVFGRHPGRTAEAAQFIGGAAAPAPLAQLARSVRRVLIAVPDSGVPQAAEALAQAGYTGGLALHTSGALGPEALDALARLGVSCAALHPLQTFATRQQGMAVLPGSSFGLSGEGAARAWAESVVHCLHGHILNIRAADRPRYHAAAVMASNYVVGLIGAAVMLMKTAGISETDALRALGPLIEASVENALSLGPVQALTGPVARGDATTVRLHLASLRDADERLRALYRAAGLQVLALAVSRGLEPELAAKLEIALTDDGEGNG